MNQKKKILAFLKKLSPSIWGDIRNNKKSRKKEDSHACLSCFQYDVKFPDSKDHEA